MKPPQFSKARLGGILPDGERARLAMEMFRTVLSAACRARLVAAVYVVTRDAGAAAMAAEAGAQALDEGAANSLNDALEQALLRAAPTGRTVMILHADLPLATPEAIDETIRAHVGAGTATIAPDLRGEGTNALLFERDAPLRLRFGEDSLRRHVEAALAAGLEPRLHRSEAIAFDVDLPEDLDRLGARRSAEHAS